MLQVTDQLPLGHRAKERLRGLDEFEDLMLLSDLDRQGRQRGAVVSTIAEALEYVRSLEGQWA